MRTAAHGDDEAHFDRFAAGTIRHLDIFDRRFGAGDFRGDLGEHAALAKQLEADVRDEIALDAFGPCQRHPVLRTRARVPAIEPMDDDAAPGADMTTNLVAGQGIAATRGIEQNGRAQEHTSELQSLMRLSYAVFCLKKKRSQHNRDRPNQKSESTPRLSASADS